MQGPYNTSYLRGWGADRSGSGFRRFRRSSYPGYRGRCSTGFAGHGRGYRNRFYETGQPGWLRYSKGWPEPISSEAAYEVSDVPGQTEMKRILQAQIDYYQECIADCQKRLDEMSPGDEKKE